MTREIWKDIDGYVGIYQISNLGNSKNKKEKILRPKNNKKYKQVALNKNGKKKFFFVHRLVAKAFIDNPKQLNEVNHKNENTTDNRVENLEWCNHKYNVNYGTRNIKTALKNGKEVCQFDKEGNLLKTFKSTRSAERECNILHQNISDCCNGKVRQAGEFIWKYK